MTVALQDDEELTQSVPFRRPLSPACHFFFPLFRAELV